MVDEFGYQAIETLDHVGYLKIEERAFARPPTLRLFLMWGHIPHAPCQRGSPLDFHFQRANRF